MGSSSRGENKEYLKPLPSDSFVEKICMGVFSINQTTSGQFLPSFASTPNGNQLKKNMEIPNGVKPMHRPQMEIS